MLPSFLKVVHRVMMMIVVVVDDDDVQSPNDESESPDGGQCRRVVRSTSLSPLVSRLVLRRGVATVALLWGTPEHSSSSSFSSHVVVALVVAVVVVVQKTRSVSPLSVSAFSWLGERAVLGAIEIVGGWWSRRRSMGRRLSTSSTERTGRRRI